MHLQAARHLCSSYLRLKYRSQGWCGLVVSLGLVLRWTGVTTCFLACMFCAWTHLLRTLRGTPLRLVLKGCLKPRDQTSLVDMGLVWWLAIPTAEDWEGIKRDGSQNRIHTIGVTTSITLPNHVKPWFTHGIFGREDLYAPLSSHATQGSSFM